MTAIRLKPVLLLCAMMIMALPACAPYKMDIRQGNLVTPEARARLKLGMTREQVRVLLGQPLVSDQFHPERWDYVYRYEHKRQLEANQRMTLYFKNDALVRIDDSHMPPLAASAPSATTGGNTP